MAKQRDEAARECRGRGVSAGPACPCVQELTRNFIFNIYSITENYVGMSRINRGGKGKMLSPG